MTRATLLALTLAACGGADVPPTTPVATTPDAPSPVPPQHDVSAVITKLPPGEASDGRGNIVVAATPVGVELGGGWGARALDPILVVGENRFTAYDHPRPGVLRFLVADEALLTGVAGARVTYGEAPAGQGGPFDEIDVSEALQAALRNAP